MHVLQFQSSLTYVVIVTVKIDEKNSSTFTLKFRLKFPRRYDFMKLLHL